MTLADQSRATEKRTYWCFISYRHADNKDPGRQWATWLHQAIETYEIPSDLVGSTNARGETIPQRIFPVFRDEEELPVDADLASPIYRALDNSKCLLTICSPRAVQSEYVSNEIRYFKKLGRSDRVLAAIIDGEPDASWDTAKQAAGFRPEQECFPEPLRHQVDSDGRLLEARSEPIAADFRLPNGGQGWTTVEAYRQALKQAGTNPRTIAAAVEDYRKKSDLMKLKVVAGVLSVDLGILTKRDSAYQLALAQTRARGLRRWLAGVTVLAFLAIAGGLLAVLKEREAAYQRDQTEQAHAHLLIDTASTRLREHDVRLAEAIGLAVLEKRKSDSSIQTEASVILQEARAADFELAGLAGHTDIVTFASFSPDGERVVTASADATLAIWDVTTGARLAVLKGHAAAVRSAVYSPDGSRIVSASADGTVRVWNAISREQVAVLKGHAGAVNSAVFSPDGMAILSASDDKTVRIWDASTFAIKMILTGHSAPVSAAVYSHDGQNIVSASQDKTACIWDAKTGQPKLRLSGHSESVSSAVCSPDGRYVLTASQDKTVRVFNTLTGEGKIILSGLSRDIKYANYSPDGARIVTASGDKTARIWDAETGAQLMVLAGHLDSVSSAMFSPDGAFILTASRDKSARIWSVTPPGQEAVFTGHTDIVTSAAYSPSGTNVIASSGDKSVIIWDRSSHKIAGRLSGHTAVVDSATYSPDGAHILTASYDGSARVWDAKSLVPVLSLIGHKDAVTSAVYSPDGKAIATGSFDKTIRVWNSGTAEVKAVLGGHDGAVRSVAFSPDGLYLASASDDHTARVWNLSNGEKPLILRGHADAVRSAAYSPDGLHIVTSSNDQTGIVWDASTGRRQLTLSGHKSVLRSASYSPSGRYIVTASYDSTARVWDAVNGFQLAVFQVHGDGVRSATYSSNGREILTASLDKTAVIWDARLAADAKTQLNWLKAALFDPLTALEISQLGLVTNSSADGTNSSFVAKFLSAARLKLKNAFRLKSSKPTGADNALHDSDPQSLVKKAAQDELAAVASPNSNKSTDLLLAAFNEYCAALRLQPDGKDSAYWRFRRATLARRFARLGALDQIAKAFDRE